MTTGHEVAMALRAAYLALHRQTNDCFSDAGVTADQFVVLAALAEGDALTQQDLVSRTFSDPNTLRAMLVLLERRRLIERRPHPTDGRQVNIELTAKGVAVRKSAREAKRTWLAHAVAQLDEQDRETLFAAGEIIKRLVEE